VSNVSEDASYRENLFQHYYLSIQLHTMTTFPTSLNKQVKKNVSYGQSEVERLTKKEQYLMNRFRWNYSQLHKNLVEDRYDLVEAA